MISWDTVLEYYKRNRAKIEAEARAQLNSGVGARAIAYQHRTYILARRLTGRTDVILPVLDRIACQVRGFNPAQK